MSQSAPTRHSGANAYVTSLMLQIKAIDPRLSNREIQSIILSTAKDGVLQPAAAIRKARQQSANRDTEGE